MTSPSGTTPKGHSLMCIGGRSCRSGHGVPQWLCQLWWQRARRAWTEGRRRSGGARHHLSGLPGVRSTGLGRLFAAGQRRRLIAGVSCACSLVSYPIFVVLILSQGYLWYWLLDEKWKLGQ
jgi:hypothetical protein